MLQRPAVQRVAVEEKLALTRELPAGTAAM